MVDLKELLTKFDRVYDNQKGDQYKLKGTFGEAGFFTREQAEQMYEKMIGKVVYQKGLEPGMVQTEFPAHKTVIKPLGKENITKSTRKTELDFFGVETSDRPHLESFGLDVTAQMKRVDEIIDKIDECYDTGCGNLGGLISEAKTELKKLPVLHDEEIIEVKCENPPRCASGPRKAYVIIEDKTYAANCVSPTTATRIHNQYYKKYFPMDSHSLKCNDNFTVKDDKIKLVSFFGSEPVFIVFASGEKQYPPIKAKYKLE